MQGFFPAVPAVMSYSVLIAMYHFPYITMESWYAITVVMKR